MANAVLCSSWKHQARLTSSNESHGCSGEASLKSVANVTIKITFKFILLINLKYISIKRKEWIFTFCHAFSEHNSKIKVELAIHRSLTCCPVLFFSLPTLIIINVQWLAAAAAFRWRPRWYLRRSAIIISQISTPMSYGDKDARRLDGRNAQFCFVFWRVRNFLLFWKMSKFYQHVFCSLKEQRVKFRIF